jgi:uncharacterized alkaline shock family protein YloU
MDVDKKNKYGKINISLDAVAEVAGTALSSVFGVVGLVKGNLNLSESINVILKKERFSEGVRVKKDKKNKYIIDISVVLAYGVRVPEVVSEIQSQVAYNLNKAFDLKFEEINVYVQSIRNL